MKHLTCIAVALAGAAALGGPVSVDADSSETLGMYKPAKTAAGATVLGVPFVKSPTLATNTVDTLLVAGYGSYDMIRVWDAAEASGSEYDTWSWNQKSNGWVAVRKSTGAYPAPAAAYDVPRGYAFWFTDMSRSTNDLVQAGLVKTGAVTKVARGSVGNVKLTLLVNPYGAEINAAAKLAVGAATGDQMTLVGGSERYEYKDGEGWGRWVRSQVVIKGKTIYGKPEFVKSDAITVPAGTAFWYLSVGGSPSVAWDEE